MFKDTGILWFQSWLQNTDVFSVAPENIADKHQQREQPLKSLRPLVGINGIVFGPCCVFVGRRTNQQTHFIFGP